MTVEDGVLEFNEVRRVDSSGHVMMLMDGEVKLEGDVYFKCVDCSEEYLEVDGSPYLFSREDGGNQCIPPPCPLCGGGDTEAVVLIDNAELNSFLSNM